MTMAAQAGGIALGNTQASTLPQAITVGSAKKEIKGYFDHLLRIIWLIMK
jgi:hypothetical protein